MTSILPDFQTIANSSSGPQKLREMILSLAVRGKLVPQDPDDEPASELLKKINAEKERMVREGVIKKPKPLPPVDPNEVPYDLPEGWEWIRLAQIAKQIHYGYTASTDETIIEPKFLRITDIQNGEVHWPAVPGCRIKESEISKYACCEGDILIARTGGTIGKSYLFPSVDFQCVFASYLIRVVPLWKEFSRYITRFIESPPYWVQLYGHSMGTGQPNVNGTALSNLLIPFPPLSEQQRIVERVEELMKLVDELEEKQTTKRTFRISTGKAALRDLTEADNPDTFQHAWERLEGNFDALFSRDRENIKALRQTVLSLAVRGKLAPQNPDDEPASELLKKIAAEKDRMIREGLIRKPKPLPPIEPNEIPYELPKGWEWCRLGTLGFTQTGTTPSTKNPGYYNNDYAFIKPADISANGIDYSGHGLSKSGIAVGRLIPKQSNLMVCIGGSIGKVGYTDRDASCNQQINAITCYNLNLSLFLDAVLRSEPFQHQVLKKAPSTTLPILSKGKWEQLNVPVPPLKEQHRIVERVNSLMEIIDLLEDGVAQSTRIAEQYAEAVVRSMD